MCIPPGQPLAEFLPHTRQDFRALSEVLWNVAGRIGMLYGFSFQYDAKRQPGELSGAR